MDTYTRFRDLNTNEKEGRDFQVVIRRGDPRVAVLAIHGGGIEPGTLDLADGVAGDDYTLYCFKGAKPKKWSPTVNCLKLLGNLNPV